MDDKTKDGVLAAIAYRRVEALRRDLLTDIVTGEYTATRELPPVERVRARFDALWVPPAPAYLADMVAAKCTAAVAFHESELVWAATEIDRVGAQARPAGERELNVANAVEEDQAGRIRQHRADAQALLERAVSAGGNPQAAPPPGPVKVTPASVAEYVETLIEGGF